MIFTNQVGLFNGRSVEQNSGLIPFTAVCCEVIARTVSFTIMRNANRTHYSSHLFACNALDWVRSPIINVLSWFVMEKAQNTGSDNIIICLMDTLDKKSFPGGSYFRYLRILEKLNGSKCKVYNQTLILGILI